MFRSGLGRVIRVRHGSRCANHSIATKPRTHFSWPGCFFFQFDPWSACGCRALPGHLRVLQRSGRGSERSAETERGDQLVSKLPATHLAVACVGRPRFASGTGLGAARSTPVRPWRQRRLHLGLGAPLSDQLSVVDPTNTFSSEEPADFSLLGHRGTPRRGRRARSDRGRDCKSLTRRGASAARTRRSTHSVCEQS